MALHSSNTVKNYNIITKLVFTLLLLIERGFLLFFELLIRLFSLLGFKSLHKKKQQLIKKDYNTWADFVQKKREDQEKKGKAKEEQPKMISGLLQDYLQPKPLTESQKSKIKNTESDESKKNI